MVKIITRNSFPALLLSHKAVARYAYKPYLGCELTGVSVAAHHSPLVHEVGISHRLPVSATRSTGSCGHRAASYQKGQARQFPPGYGKKDLPAGRRGLPSPGKGGEGAGRGGGRRRGQEGQRRPLGARRPRGQRARPAGHRHSRLGGVQRRSALGAGRQGVGRAAVAVEDGGGRRPLGVAGGKHGGVRRGRGGPGPRRLGEELERRPAPRQRSPGQRERGGAERSGGGCRCRRRGCSRRAEPRARRAPAGRAALPALELRAKRWL